MTEAQAATLESAMIPRWAIERLTIDFRAIGTADPSDRKPLVAWRKCLAKAITRQWNNPAQRPRRDDAESDDESPIPPAEPLPSDWRERLAARAAERQAQAQATYDAAVASGRIVDAPIPKTPAARMAFLREMSESSKSARSRANGTTGGVGSLGSPKTIPDPQNVAGMTADGANR